MIAFVPKRHEISSVVLGAGDRPGALVLANGGVLWNIKELVILA